MKRKIFFMVLGLLTLYVVIQMINARGGNIDHVNNQIRIVEKKLQENYKDKQRLMEEKREMENTLVSIPQAILEGFEDPERQFVDFMDYVNNSKLKNMNGSIVISQIQTYKNQPVPLQESRFEFVFNMESTRQLEEFLDYLLIKGKYPLSVQRIEIRRVPRQHPQVNLQVALLLPAKIDLPQFAQRN